MVTSGEPFVSEIDSDTDTRQAGGSTPGNRTLTQSDGLRGVKSCPRCRSDEVVKWGSKDGSRRFRCTQCKRTFTALTNTELAHLRHQERWISFIGAMVEHKSLREAAAICGISLSTAQRWHVRLLGYVTHHGLIGLISLMESFQELLSRL